MILKRTSEPDPPTQETLFETVGTVIVKFGCGTLLGAFALLIYFAMVRSFGPATLAIFVLGGGAFGLAAWPLLTHTLRILLKIAEWVR